MAMTRQKPVSSATIKLLDPSITNCWSFFQLEIHLSIKAVEKSAHAKRYSDYYSTTTDTALNLVCLSADTVRVHGN